MEQKRPSVTEALLAGMQRSTSLYTILDGARNFDIPFRLRSAKVEHTSLYRGRSEEMLWHVAPYLVRCEPGTAFFHWVLEYGWGNSWGIFLHAHDDLETVCRHFRQFLMVRTEDGRELYFRFYDPRVLRVYLPTCTPGESSQFFGPVQCYMMEDETSHQLLKFMLSEQGAVGETVLLRP